MSREGQPRRAETTVVVQDIFTGYRTVETRRAIPRRESTRQERALLLESWWTNNFWGPFLQAAESWKGYQAAKLAEVAGQTVEFGSALMTDVECEAKLREAFKKTLFTKIRTFGIIERIKQEVDLIKLRDPTSRQWIGGYLNSVVDILTDVRRLNNQRKASYKAYLLQKPPT